MTGRRPIQIAQPVVGDEEWEAVRGPLASGWLTQGPAVAAFEQEFAVRHGVAHALAVTSCTTGLQLALAALGVGPGDEVIVPAFTWVATANVVVHQGAVPVFVDVDPHTYNVAVPEVERAVTPRTKAVIAVHLFGLCADIDAIRAVVPEQVAVIEDAACAVGASVGGRSAGGLGEVAAFSFHPRKIITTGEGGMVTTNDADLADVASTLRNHGASVPEELRHHGPQPYLMPEFDVAGFNFRMSDLQGAIGLVQLRRLDGLIAERRQWASWYGEQLQDVGWLRPPTVPAGYGHAWQAYVTVVDEEAPQPRNEIMRRLHERGVSTRPGTHAVTSLGYYRKHAPEAFDRCPVALALQERTMAIPLHNAMTEDDFGYVVEQLVGV